LSKEALLLVATLIGNGKCGTNELIGKTMGSNKKKRGKGVYPGEFPLEFYNTLAKIFVDKDDIVLYIWANVLKVRLIIFIADIV